MLLTSHLHPVDTVTNQLVLELVKFQEKHAECSQVMTCRWIRKLFGEKWPSEDEPTTQAIIKSLERLQAKYSRLKKQREGKDKCVSILTFHEQEYSLPKLGIRKGKVVHFSPIKKEKVDKCKSTDEDTARRLMELSELNEKLKAECNSLKEKQAKFQEERGTLKERIYAAKRNATKREKRRVVVVEKQKETIKIIEKRLKSSETQIQKGRNVEL